MSVDRIKELQRQRFQYLNKVYEVTGGSELKYVNYEEIGKELGFDKDLSYNIAEFLKGEYLIEWVSLGGGLKITHYGIQEVEKALAEPDNPTDHFMPVNVINIGTMTNSQIQQDVHNSSQTQTINQNEVDGLNDELTPELNETCKDLRVNLKNWKKFHIKAIILGLISIPIFAVGVQFIPEGTPASNIPEITIPTIISSLIPIFFAGKEERKAEKERRKNLGYNKLTLFSHQALEHLEKYEKEPDFNHMKESGEKLKLILNNLEINWDSTYKYSQSFKSLECPIEEFKKSLRENFIPAYLEISQDVLKTNKQELEKRKKSLIHLIQLFQSNNFQLVIKVAEELKKYIPKEKPAKETRWHKLQENRIQVKVIKSIIGSAFIIVGSVSLSYLLSQNPTTTYSDFITWSIVLSGIGLGILNPIIFVWKK